MLLIEGTSFDKEVKSIAKIVNLHIGISFEPSTNMERYQIYMSDSAEEIVEYN